MSITFFGVISCTTEASSNNQLPTINIISNSTNPNWITNNITRSANITNGAGIGILENVPRVQIVEINSLRYELMKGTGIPKYDFPIRQI